MKGHVIEKWRRDTPVNKGYWTLYANGKLVHTPMTIMARRMLWSVREWKRLNGSILPQAW